MAIKRIGRPCFRKYDRRFAAKKAPRALTKLGALEERMFKTGQKFGLWRNTLSDGSKITVARIAVPGGPPIRIVRIRTREGAPAEIIFTSCLLETGLALVPVDALGIPLAFVNWPSPIAEAAAAGEVPPMLIYVGRDLREYFEGSGTSLPSGIYEDHSDPVYLVQGIEDPALTCPWDPDKGIIDWPKEAPALSLELQTITSLAEYEAYSSNIYTNYARVRALTGECNAPGLYSGLLRLAAQSKIGVGQPPARLAVWVDADCSLNPGRDGLFLDDNGVWWLFRIDSGGCYAHRMKMTDCAKCVHQWIVDAEGTDAEQIMFNAFVMAQLSRDPGYSDVEVLTETDLATVYSNEKESLSDHDWHYSHGHLGVGAGEITEASIVIHEIYNDGSSIYREAYRFKIDFDLSGAVPTAVITEEESAVKWEFPDDALLFYNKSFVNGDKLCREQKTLTSVIQGSNSPLYCYYRKEGLEVLAFTHTSGALVTEPRPTMQICGFGEKYFYGTQYFGGTGTKNVFSLRLQGFSVGTQAPDNAGTSHRYDEGYLKCVSDSVHICTHGIYTQLDIWATGSGGCNDLDITGWPTTSVEHTMQVGQLDGYLKQTYVSGFQNTVLSFIPHGDCESIYIGELGSGTVTSESLSIYNDWSDTFSNRITTAIVTWTSATDSATVFVPISPSVSFFWGFGCGKYYYNGGVTSAGTPATAGDPYRKCQMHLSTVDGNLVSAFEGMSQDYDDWYEWLTWATFTIERCRDRTMWTQQSYNWQDTYFVAGPYATKALVNEYGVITPNDSNTNIRFLGFN